MGDVLESTVNSSQPLVVSSTIRKAVDEVSPVERFLQSGNGDNLDNSYPISLASQNIIGGVDTQIQQPRHPVHSSHQSHGHSPSSHPEGLHSIPTDNSHICTRWEMATHPQFRNSSTEFQLSMVTDGYQAYTASSVPSLANAVYYTYPNPRYLPIYYSPPVPQYTPQTIPGAQLPSPQGTYFYAPGYPHPYPQNHSLVTTPTLNAPHQQSPLHPPPARWSPVQHPIAQYVYIRNTFTPKAGPRPMQPSFSHPAPSRQQGVDPQQPSEAPFRYIRRHSHPSRYPPVRERLSDFELLQLPHSGWTQVTRGNSQSDSQIIGSTTTAPASNILDSSTTYTYPTPPLSSSIQLPDAHVGDGASPAQAAETRVTISGTHPALHRGPPRKPRQSGHALWVGNLPPGTNVIELKDHFSRGAINEIESVFHISKSNCAFINYKTDAACNEAMVRFHDNRFKGARLVCRLRKNSVGPPPGAAMSRDRTISAEGMVEQEVQSERWVKIGMQAIEGVDMNEGDTRAREKHKDRIFILKSLTVEDLDLSVKDSVWATQSHNEEVLNRAFEVCTRIRLPRNILTIESTDIRKCLSYFLGK